MNFLYLLVCVGFTVFVVNLHAEGECENLMTSLRESLLTDGALIPYRSVSDIKL